MEPRIQYAKTTDGVSIAFWTAGHGVPLVIPPNLSGSHLQVELSMSPAKVLSRLVEQVQVVRYDCRGMGMSQRDAIDFSPEAAERDLEAVVDRLGLDRFTLYGNTVAGPVSFWYASRHPDRVSSLVYWVGQTVRRSPEIMHRLSLIEPLAEQDWELYNEIRARVMFGWDSSDAGTFVALAKAAHTPESLRLGLQVIAESLGAEVPSDIRVPTLVLHLQGSEWTTNIARAVASRISSAHVLAVPGPPATGSPFVYDSEIWVAAIVDFINGSWQEGPAVGTPELKLGAMRAILWTDVEEHTALMQRLGDAKGREVLRDHERLTRDALSAHDGTEVKAMGDGFMAWFSSAQRALECAIALQQAFAMRSQSATEPLRVRVGVNAGEPIAEEDDLFGAAVIAAARICREAAGGEIVVSDVVRQLVAGKGFRFADRGETALRGFEDPVRLYEVRWRDG
jgi:class 3 adenylate cyclase/pimeloyl-ACP methyl ester carboxylesterase